MTDQTTETVPGVTRWRAKPVVIEALLLTEGNGAEAAEWCHGVFYPRHDPRCDPLSYAASQTWVDVGDGRGEPGDWIVSGRDGCYRALPAAEFAAEYEPAETPAAAGEPPDTAGLRQRIEHALYVSIDRCARCKVCDSQINAVMAVLGEVAGSPAPAPSAPLNGCICPPDPAAPYAACPTHLMPPDAALPEPPEPAMVREVRERAAALEPAREMCRTSFDGRPCVWLEGHGAVHQDESGMTWTTGGLRTVPRSCIDDRELADRLTEAFPDLNPALTAALGEVLAQVMTARDEGRRAWDEVGRQAESKVVALHRLDGAGTLLRSAACDGMEPGLRARLVAMVSAGNGSA